MDQSQISLTLSIITAGIAIFAAVRAVKTERQVAWVAERSQAEKIASWVTENGLWAYRNGSPAPVYDWRIGLQWNDIHLGYTERRATLAPNEADQQNFREEIQERIARAIDQSDEKFHYRRIRTSIEFTDTRGVRWERGLDGLLRKTDAAT